MASCVWLRPAWRGLIAFVVLTIPVASVVAAEPPKVDRLFPAGGQLGTSVDVTIAGKIGDGDVKLWSDLGQIQSAISEDRKKVTLTIPADAAPGVHWLRFHNEAGVSALKPFVVGQVAEMSEQEPNNHPDGAGKVEGQTVTINGVLQKAGDVDIYQIDVPAGRTLVASMQANRVLGSPMDSVLQLLDANGTVVAQNDDDHNIDPQITYAVTQDAIYFVRAFAFPSAPNSTIKLAGSAAYIYRLTLTHGPFIDHVIPAVVDHRSGSAVTVCGWNLAEHQGTAGITSFEGLRAHVGQDCAMPHAVAAVSHSSQAESDASRAFAVGSSITGKIAVAGEKDTYTLPGVKGQKVTVKVCARELHSLLDPVLTITSADGKVLSEADDRSKADLDGEATVTVPADGPVTVTVGDRYGEGGFRFFYVLTSEVTQPTFTATVGADQYVLNQDEPLDVPITITRKNGFAQKLSVAIEGLPEGVTAEPVVSEPKGDSSKAVTLKLTRSETAVAFSGVVRVTCRIDESDVRQPATIALGNSKMTTPDIWLTVIPKEMPAEEEPAAEKSEEAAPAE